MRHFTRCAYSRSVSVSKTQSGSSTSLTITSKPPLATAIAPPSSITPSFGPSFNPSTFLPLATNFNAHASLSSTNYQTPFPLGYSSFLTLRPSTTPSTSTPSLLDVMSKLESQRQRIDHQQKIINEMRRRETIANDRLSKTSMDATVKSQTLEMVTGILKNVVSSVTNGGHTIGGGGVMALLDGVPDDAAAIDVVPSTRRLSPPPQPTKTTPIVETVNDEQSRFTELHDDKTSIVAASVETSPTVSRSTVTPHSTYRHAYDQIDKQAREADAKAYADSTAKEESANKARKQAELEAIIHAKERRIAEQKAIDEEREKNKALKVSRLRQGQGEGGEVVERWESGKGV